LSVLLRLKASDWLPLWYLQTCLINNKHLQTELDNTYLRKFEDTKWAVRSRISKLKDGSQYNGQNKTKKQDQQQ